MLLATVSVGTTRLTADAGIVSAGELMPFLACLAALGAGIDHRPEADGGWSCEIVGRGLGGLDEPSMPLAASGSAALLLAAVLATHPIRSVLAGAELPPDLLAALRLFGASISAGSAAGPAAGPFWISGALRPVPPPVLDIAPPLFLPLALAALNVPGVVTLAGGNLERTASLLRAFAADIAVMGDRLVIRGEAELRPAVLHLVPHSPASS